RESDDAHRDKAQAGNAGRKPQLRQPALFVTAPGAGAAQKRPKRVDEHGRSEPAPGGIAGHRVELGGGWKEGGALPREKLHLLREDGPGGGVVARDLRESQRVDKAPSRYDHPGPEKASAMRAEGEPKKGHSL